MSPPAPFDPSGLPPLCIVINAGSGRGDQQQRIDTLKRVFDDAGRAHSFFMIERSAQIGEIARQAVAQAATARSMRSRRPCSAAAGRSA